MDELVKEMTTLEADLDNHLQQHVSTDEDTCNNKSPRNQRDEINNELKKVDSMMHK